MNLLGVNSITVSPESISEFGVSNSVLYASTSNGVFVSQDSGRNWTELSTAIGTGHNGLPSGSSYVRVIVDIEEPNIIYAASSNSKLYRSIDKGSSWEELSTFEGDINGCEGTSFSTNFIFLAKEDTGISCVEDPIRDSYNLEVQSDGKIINFDVNYLEMGDTFFTDTNTIQVKTMVKNDSVTDTREQVRFTLNDESKYLSIKFYKNKEKVSLSDLYVGQDLSHPYSNPMTLQVPTNSIGNMVVHNVGKIGTGELYTCTNRGVYLSINDGDIWQKLNSSLIPEEVFSIISDSEGELLLGTSSGLWKSQEGRSSYRNVELGLSGQKQPVRVIWEEKVAGTTTIYRAGDRGLYITVTRPAERSMIVHSGPFGSGEAYIKFCWGDLFDPNDGGWSESTTGNLSQKNSMYNGGRYVDYIGWQGALIFRTGPFLTLEKAKEASRSGLYFSPENSVVYPPNTSSGSPSVGSSIIYNTSDTYCLEEIRDMNEVGNGAVGISISPQKVFMGGGSILIGDFKNINASIYPSINNWPSTNVPIIDKVQPIIGPTSDGRSNPNENYADDSEGNYSLSELNRKLPVLKENRYYIYRIYPYRMLPNTMIVDQNGNNPLFPRYIPFSGDMVESFSYIIDIEQMSGAKTIICGTSTDDQNWMIGTDDGVYYSTESGRNVVEAQSTLVKNKKITCIAFSSLNGESVVIAAAIDASNVMKIVKSTRTSTTQLGINWEAIDEANDVLYQSRVSRIYSIKEASGKIYVSTNVGIFESDDLSVNWKLIGQPGDSEGLFSEKSIGQEFVI